MGSIEEDLKATLKRIEESLKKHWQQVMIELAYAMEGHRKIHAYSRVGRSRSEDAPGQAAIDPSITRATMELKRAGLNARYLS